ncbi:hypothetical protein ACLK1S_05780 [Escherichia coli]
MGTQAHEWFGHINKSAESSRPPASWTCCLAGKIPDQLGIASTHCITTYAFCVISVSVRQS